ncbi:MAG: hypothetical protein KF779_00910 [Hyphomonadaceae bacterium]|nr:hypothetical protein [Hyphomonadaceae bacterium]
MRESEVAAKLAIEGAVAAIDGSVKGKLGIKPRVLGPSEKAEIGMSDIGDTLFYEVGDGGVLFHSDGAFTTVWFANGDYDKGVTTLDKLIKKHYPGAKMVKDEPHETEPGLKTRTYDIRLAGNHLAIVDTVYVAGVTAMKRFMIRVTAMARQN